MAVKAKPYILLLAAVSYVPVLCLIPLLFKRKDEFIIHHAKQGLTLFGIEVATVVLGIIPFVGLLVSAIILRICILLSLWGMAKALMHRHTHLILISHLAQKINL